ncbi:Exodeoxyribonuclease I subunit D [Moraxella cuniculi DSM 21768]|uniref:Nuclease SbcCD subunit D n=1 Tax=Moraxella cuniculi DSM 21768 TaxID=1122245 RepID=A0A1N7DBP0_9GAMM|nr:exonuclease SbcCD subunit D C-terminal domain-containing protein [Moraxella cuniculi]SIR73232.1 Exodeoxyribonuclease I subunit D [Moraxella cuniculi DSM 21768]
MNVFKTHLVQQSQTPALPPKPKDALRILHTSDWHLGKLLYNQPRYHEFANFLDWLQDSLVEFEVDVLIVAGDIFDTMAPSNRAEHLYHQFLATAFKRHIKHIIIVAGNHDSPTSLQKTKEVLGVLNTHVVGSISQNMADDIITLYDDDTPLAIVMTVPYLRDRDVRGSIDPEQVEHHDKLLLSAVADYYHSLAKLAKKRQDELKKTYQISVPIIATGHLYAAGASVSSADDGMRDIQIGTLGQISASIFDDTIDYVALGHIHAAQKVGKQERIRYCGSPIAMGFGEIGRQKQVLIIDIHKENNDKKQLSINSLPVPIFQGLAKIAGDMTFIQNCLDKLKATQQEVWLEIEYTGETLIGNLKQQIDTLLDDSKLVAISIKNKARHQGSLQAAVWIDNPKNLDEMDIFLKRLNKEKITNEDKEQLILAYQSLLKSLHEQDGNA